MVKDTVPPRFGEGTDYLVGNIFKKEELFRDFEDEGLWQSNELIRSRKEEVLEILRRLFGSLTGQTLEDFARIHILPSDDFMCEFNKNDTIEYGQDYDPTQIPHAFQSGYRVFINDDVSFISSLMYAAHEIGGTIIPHKIRVKRAEDTQVDYHINSKTNSSFLLETAQYYMTLAAFIKMHVEKGAQFYSTLSTDLTGASVHYAAIMEAGRLLKKRTTPLREYRRYYNGDSKISYKASIPDLSSLVPRWRTKEECSNICGQNVLFSASDFI